MVNEADTNKAKLNRRRRVRGKVAGTIERPRLSVFHSAKNIYAQIIDDAAEVILVITSTLGKELTGNGRDKEATKRVSELIVKRAAEKGITEVVFDRGGRIFHGRVKKLAEGTRGGGFKL